MTTTPWQAHVNRGGFKPSEHVGQLAFITVLSEQEETTMNGPAMTVRANITLLDGPDAGSTHPNVTLYGPPIVRDLLGTSGSTRLARFGSRPNRNPSLNDAIVLDEPKPEDADVAQKAWKFHESAYGPKSVPWEAQTASVAPEPAQEPAKPTRGRAAKKAMSATQASMADPFAGAGAKWSVATGEEPGF